ncbi:TnpV protein [Chakrabartyella piscis]|uniref:TnpV protein n=1 Tax=Chakrabartyella piscis TaxID=2918914 RepID=UPI002958B475|nr:TnpV protein [Chakrabartyella piscis]
MNMNNLTYQKNGDYQIPNLTLGLEDYPETVGKYGLLRETHLKNHRRGTYSRMLTDGSLWPHLCEIDKQATDQVDLMMEQMMKSQNVTEELKAKDQMLWVQMVTNIKAQAEEVVLREMIYC